MAVEARTALVTGATGYLGGNLCRYLGESGWTVHALCRPGPKTPALAAQGISVHEYDGSTARVAQIVGDSRPDVVFHLASLFLAQHHPDDLAPMIQANVLLGTQLLEAMTQQGVLRFVNTGTAWQHYQNADYNPVNLYAATKQAMEDILRFYCGAFPLAAITLELFDTYGPDDPRPKLFTLLRKVARTQEPLGMSAGEQLLDLVYVDDVVEGFRLAAGRLLSASGGTHEKFVLAAGTRIKLREVVATYARVMKVELPIQFGARPYRPREVMVPWEHGHVLPGWRPRVSLEEGIRKMEQPAPNP